MVNSRFKYLSVIVLVLILVFISACSNNAGNNTEGDSNSNSNSNTTENNAVDTPDAPAMAEGPFGKYDPPINITTVEDTNSGVKYLPDQTKEDNVWTREFASELGINLTHDWIVNAAQYPSKITVTMVSGDMPDFFEVDMQKFQTLVEAGQLADLTEIYDTYASDFVKSARGETSMSDKIGMKAGRVDEKLYGINRDGASNDDVQLLYIRQDWLDNLGLEAPKTMDDLINIALAFTNDDPDGNGKPDTYGLALSNTLFGGMTSISGFINGYGGYAYNPANGPGTSLLFMKDADGKAIYADIQPEVKTALGKLAELFDAGAIHPEFSVMNDTKAGQTMTESQVGMSYGEFWLPTWPINNMHIEDNSVDWSVHEAPSATGSPSILQSPKAVPSRFMVVSKDSEHPEALIKIDNYVSQKLNVDKDVGKYHTIKQGEDIYPIHTLAPLYTGIPEKNQIYHSQVIEALDAGDTSGLDEEAKLYYDQVKAYKDGDHTQWVANTLWGEGGVFATLGIYKENNRIFMTAYTGAPTPTMVARGPALRDLEVRAFTDIIMGVQPLDYFDEFAKQWAEQGGNDILAEVNETGQVQ